MENVTVLVAKYFILVPVIVTAVVFFHLHGKWRLRFVVTVVVGAIIAYGLAKIGSHLYNNPRPFVQGNFVPLLPHAADNGFPSDHTLLAAFLGWACFAFSKKAGLVALLSAVLIGASRMAAGVHHLIDIVGSMVFAAIGAYVAYWLALRLMPLKPKAQLTPKDVSAE